MNQRIDHINYEAWLLDRLEGNLTADQEAELDLFLILHPELAPLDDALPTVSNITDRLEALDKEALKRALPPVAPITPQNVEDHLIARIEGDLDPAQQQALEQYLLAHPEHSREEQLIELTKVKSLDQEFNGKDVLARQLPPVGAITKYTIEDHLIAHVEGDLSVGQERALRAWMKEHPEVQHELSLLQTARIVRTSRTYPAKDQLKKEARVIPINWAVRLAAAASIAALIGFGGWFLMFRTPPDHGIVRIEPEQKVVPIEIDVQPTEKRQVPVVKQEVSSGTVHHDPSSAVVPDPVEPEPRVVPAPLPEEPLIVELPEEGKEPREEEVEGLPLNEAPEEILLAAGSETPSSVRQRTTTVGGLLASTVRETMLNSPATDTRPLDGDDAVAVIDRGLKVVSGRTAGFAVERNDDGGVRKFQLRIGRSFGVTAGR